MARDVRRGRAGADLPLRSSREAPRWRWITWGSALAAILWLGASALFSWYAANFGKFNETYGSLGAAIGFMTWLWISAIVILLGAEFDAEMEHQTARDTTTGSEKSMGARGASMADPGGRGVVLAKPLEARVDNRMPAASMIELQAPA